jgi:hypothetical protein
MTEVYYLLRRIEHWLPVLVGLGFEYFAACSILRGIASFGW